MVFSGSLSSSVCYRVITSFRSGTFGAAFTLRLRVLIFTRADRISVIATSSMSLPPSFIAFLRSFAGRLSLRTRSVSLQCQILVACLLYILGPAARFCTLHFRVLVGTPIVSSSSIASWSLETFPSLLLGRLSFTRGSCHYEVPLFSTLAFTCVWALAFSLRIDHRLGAHRRRCRAFSSRLTDLNAASLDSSTR
jgi:hypothetical protein